MMKKDQMLSNPIVHSLAALAFSASAAAADTTTPAATVPTPPLEVIDSCMIIENKTPFVVTLSAPKTPFAIFSLKAAPLTRSDDIQENGKDMTRFFLNEFQAYKAMNTLCGTASKYKL